MCSLHTISLFRRSSLQWQYTSRGGGQCTGPGPNAERASSWAGFKFGNFNPDGVMSSRRGRGVSGLPHSAGKCRWWLALPGEAARICVRRMMQLPAGICVNRGYILAGYDGGASIASSHELQLRLRHGQLNAVDG